MRFRINDKKDYMRRLKKSIYIYLYMVMIFILILGSTSLYYWFRMYTQYQLLKSEIVQVKNEKLDLEKKIDILEKSEKAPALMPSLELLKDLLIKSNEEQLLLREEMAKVREDFDVLQQWLIRIEENLKTFEEVSYQVEFIDEANLGGIYGDLVDFGIKDGKFVGKIRNNWQDSDFLFIDFEILIEFYSVQEGANYKCQPIHIIIQNQTSQEFSYRPETEDVITPEDVEGVNIKIKQLLLKKPLRESMEEVAEEVEEEEETLTP
ncbi:MAG TPA: hypothetical protein ENG55_03040 [Candidatus Omnitrophica bacterium]|nr:hypothetical protein [Candidatus Omnitrophota bacterium]